MFSYTLYDKSNWAAERSKVVLHSKRGGLAKGKGASNAGFEMAPQVSSSQTGKTHKCR